MKNFHQMVRVKGTDELITCFWDFIKEYNLEELIDYADFIKLNNLEDAWKYCAEQEELKNVAEETELLIISNKEYDELLNYEKRRGSTLGYLEYVKYSW